MSIHNRSPDLPPDGKVGDVESTPGLDQPRLPLHWVAIAIILLAAITTSRVYASLAMKGVAEPFSTILMGESLKWGLWLPMAGIAIYAEKRGGFEVARPAVAFGRHLLLAILLLALHTAVMTYVGQAAGWYFAQDTPGATALFRVLHEGAEVMLVYAAIIGVYHGRKQHAEREQARLAKSRLQARLATERLRNLQSQLHPHFLFNSLHAVAGLLREGDREGAVQTVTALGDLLRMALRRSEQAFVLLSEELDLLEAYLHVQQARHGEALEVTWKLDAQVLNAQVPHLVLQPLLENAIRHGIERVLSQHMFHGHRSGSEWAAEQNRASRGQIVISARAHQNVLVLEVMDNGPGPQSGTAVGASEEGGLGLRNTVERLSTLYGSDYRLELLDRDGGGSVARLEIPLRYAGQDQ